MTRQKTDARLLCCASVIVLSLVGCTQSGKPKSGANLTDNAEPASTSSEKKSRASLGHSSGKWLRKKDKTLASAGGSKSSSQYDNLWDRLFDLYDLPPIEHEDIDRELRWFLNHPTYIERVQKRAEPFLYSIVRQVEKHDIPGEIALLPVIESAFQPHVVSPANAAGIWQFIPSTGRMYGLKQSRSYDGRRDIYASTRAAIKYLKKLHRDFDGDWLLAIAAYNCGEGAVGRAIQRNANRGLPTDFWSLDLPQETRAYVPRLLAVSKLFVESDQFGINLMDIPNQAQYKAVKVDQQLDLALAADAADMSLEQLYELNPGFKRQHTDVNGSYHLYIPADKKAADFRQELQRLVQERRTTGSDYASSSQEDLAVDAGAFASSNGGAEAATADYQPTRPQRSSIALAAYSPSPQEDSSSDASAWQKETAQRAREREATRQAKELEAAREREAEKEREAAAREAARQQAKEMKLAREREAAHEREAEREASLRAKEQQEAREREAARERDLAEREAARDKKAAHERDLAEAREAAKEAKEKAARAHDRDELDSKKHASKESDKAPAGRHGVEVASAADKADHTSGKKGAYVVQPGETLWAVARKHSVDVEQLAKWNNFSDQTQVKAGQNLVVWNKDAGKKLVMASSGIRPSQSISNYTVRQGDTLFSISKRFKVSMTELRKWNGSNVEKQIQPGKSITVQNEKD
jgi:membrane-bound lytic murein transglycosylase D